MGELRDHDEPVDDDAPTRLLRVPRVQLHPKLDPRRIPTQRRLPPLRPEDLAVRDADLPPLSARRGIGLGVVIAFIIAAYLAVLVAVILSIRAY